MPTGATVWELEWITFHHKPGVRDHHGVQWILTEESGFWGTPGPGAELTDRIAGHGATRSPGWKTARTISLTFRAYAPSHTTLRRVQTAVAGLLQDPAVPGRLTCHSEIGPVYARVFLDDEVIPTPLALASEPGVEFSMQLVAPDPRKYTVDAFTTQAGLPRQESDTGLDFNHTNTLWPTPGLNFMDTSGGLVFGEFAGDGRLVLSNPGTAPAAPVFTLHGPLVEPTLVGHDGEALRYNATLAADQHVTIDPSLPRVMLGGTANRRELVNPANWNAFVIPPADYDGTPGQLTVSLTHNDPLTADGRVVAEVRPAYL